MQRRDFLASLAVSSVALTPLVALAAGRFLVIAHVHASTNSLSGAEIETIFTTRKLYWPDGSRIIAFNFPARSALRVDFDRSALHLGPDEVARYWIDRRIRGGQPPPRQVPDADMMLRVVSKVPGSVGYLPSSASFAGVKLLGEL